MACYGRFSELWHVTVGMSNGDGINFSESAQTMPLRLFGKLAMDLRSVFGAINGAQQKDGLPKGRETRQNHEVRPNFI